MYQAIRKFNGACDPHWSTPEGQAEWGGYATFDHHLGGGTFKDAINAIRSFMSDQSKPGDKFKWGPGWKLAKERGEYDAIMKELNNPTPRSFSFVFNQDVFEVTGSSSDLHNLDNSAGVRNFSDPRLKGGWGGSDW